ncbi:protein-domain-containing protein [Phascolomyces articulosus]|uniref:Protein-domain-containing protein n=1 Tax=Phascolomyces articulosus TaxID=60185 RepID=A0AAD5K236_9FUNG|nr:protein-domain-containing protein [Phascolomyces articulosus]
MTSTISRLYDLEEIDIEDELELELARHFTQYRAAIQGKTEIELHNYLQEKASQSKRDYAEIASALLYGILTEPENARTHFQCLSFVNRDHFAAVLSKLQPIAITIKFQNMNGRTKEQILWFLNELTGLNVQNLEPIYLCLLRQIRGGDLSQANTTFCYQLLKLLESHRSWLDMYPRLMATAVYTYMRMITEHRSGQFQSLQQREIRFVIEILRSQWLACCGLGRDLIRILQDLSSIPQFSQLWNDLLNEPQSFAPSFRGINTVLEKPTPREFLRSRLTPEMEVKLLFILQHLRTNQFHRNLGWFLQKFLSQSEFFNVDVIRFIVAGWYPSNQILQSDIVPRYVVIGSMLRGIKNPVVAANVRLALIYDWLFFTPTDNIMFIEPAMLLMERSAERYPYITSVFMEFIKYSVDEYFPPMRNYMAKCVATGMRVMIEKGVIRGLMPLYACPSIDDYTRGNIKALFSEFIVGDNSGNATLPRMPSAVNMEPPLATPITVANVETPPTKTLDGEDGEIVDQHPMEDDDVDRYLYGEADGEEQGANTMDTGMEKENDIMDNGPNAEREQTPGSTATGNISESEPEPMVMEDVMVEDSSTTPVATTAPTIATATTSSPPAAMQEPSGIESNQSYWLFGDSFTRFKTASIAVLEPEQDQDDVLLQMTIAKRSLKEILSVYLRMGIPGATLASSIGPPMCDMIIQFFLQHQPSVTNDMDLDSVINDAATDTFDVLMSTLWKNEEGRDKMVDLLGSIAQHCKKSRHIVGMRWWSHVAGRAVDGTRDWLPGIVKSYKAFVSLAYLDEPIELSLTRDMQLLAEQNHTSFHTIIPLLYQYMPGHTVGNSELLQLLLALVLPEQLGQLVTLVRSGILRIYGDTIDIAFLVSTFKLDAYETGSAWQLLVAELQGQQERIENFLSMSDTIVLLQSQTLDQITPQLLSLFSTAYPTPTLLESMLQVIPSTASTTVRDKIHLIMTAFIDWKQQQKSSAALEKSMQFILNIIESQNVNDETTRQLAQQISILHQ